MPNRTKPPHLRMIAGSRRPAAPGADLPTLDRLPDPPDWLPNGHALREWQRLGPMLVANRLLSDAGLVAFGHYCALHGSLARLYEGGLAPTAAQVTALRQFAAEFGLTPTAAARVRPAPEGNPTNPFAKFGRRTESPATDGAP